jgi:hypothetical protein
MMKRMNPLRWLAWTLAFAAGLRAEAPARWDHIKTAMFFTSGDVARLLATPRERQSTLAYFAPLRLSHVYLENASPDASSVGYLRAIADDLKARGLEVSGAVVPNRNGPLAYNDPADMALLESRVRILAQVFDSIIVDDWLFTTDTSARSVADRGAQSSADYRSRLVAHEAQIHMLDAAHQVNPNCRVIIKYPNWYEGHRQNGYDPAVESREFDGVAVGIETRQLATQDQHIPAYSGYVFQRWIGGDAGAKYVGAWLDNYGMAGDFSEYAAEVWQAALARSPEIIFWCAGQLCPPVPAANDYAPLCELMPEVDRLAGLLDGAPRGIPFHLPLGSVGEYNLFGYLGMIGLPIAPVTGFPTQEAQAIFSLHSLPDPALGARLTERMRAGKEIFVTWPLWQRLRASEIGRTLDVLDDQGDVTSNLFRVKAAPWHDDTVDAGRPFTFPKIRIPIWPYIRNVALIREDGDFGVLLSEPYLGGQIDVLNLPENYYDLLRLPSPVLNAIRRTFVPQVGFQLRGPGKVLVYPFGDRQYVLYNMNDQPAPVSLRLPSGAMAGAWSERLHHDLLHVTRPGGDTDVALTLQPDEVALVEHD